ncbi:MAG: addiction module toxin, HicA family [Acidobacteriia bacterium]|nr:addiction module toxin, HicA family [Terriglobia bacterium]MYG03848.1 addiction module toxin, HicA family [Terriglobia bacterium]MYK11325.1 addiction module toxin, HicA family [Terriglobia bacterium]
MLKVRDAVRLVRPGGWSLVRIRGSHRLCRHPDKPGSTATVVDVVALGG